jgi:hypothetical protein
MQTTHLWNKLHLRRSKIIFLVIVFVGLGSGANSQGLFGLTSSSGADERLMSYGFFLSAHNATYQIRYADQFLDPGNLANNQIYSIYPKYTPGFALGFIGILRFHDQVNLLFTPTIGFYEYRVYLNYFSPNILGYKDTELHNDLAIVGLPLLFKYRSQRFNNTRMYFIGGGSYQFRTKSQDEANTIDQIVTSGRDITIEAGMGFEFYFKFFKFAPEIRFSQGLNNLYMPEKNEPQFKDAISSIKRKGITIYLNFQ